MGITNVYCLQEGPNLKIYCRLERSELKDSSQAVSNPKDPRIATQTQGFQHVTSLDLNMGYYHIRLTPKASRFAWSSYCGETNEYLCLPMGLFNSPDIFQEKMSELMEGLEFARAYIDDLLIISTGDFNQHLTHLKEVLTRLNESSLKVKTGKSFFERTQLEYLGYWIT